MNLIGADLLGQTRSLKFLLNDTGIVFFPGSQQHRDVKTHGLSYEDDYRGNAVAGILTSDHVEIRYHRAFSDERIRRLWSQVSAMPEVSKANLGRLFYQGREIG